MRMTIALGDLDKVMDDIEGDIARDATEAMRETMEAALDELRAQVVSNGLGVRLSRTWTARAFPGGAKHSINSAGYIWSRAPDIIDSFIKGATIRPINGSKYLWIPTNNVPSATAHVGRSGRKVKGGRLSPDECEGRFNAEFIVRPGRNGRLLAFMDLIGGRNGRGARRVTAGRLRQGRAPKLTLMYVLVRTARMPKLLDIEAVAKKWEASFERAFTGRLGR